MLFKPRKKSTELLTLQYLNSRMKLSAKHKQHYANLVKGYEGEKKFDLWTVKLQCDCLILNDLLLEVNNTTFQIDSLIITADRIYFYEVKNYEGDYLYGPEKDEFIKKPQHKIVNPLHQMEKGETLLNQLLFKNGFKIPIEAAVVFINDEFTLYQAPPQKPVIYPNQIKRYFNKLNYLSSKLRKHHHLLAEKLMSLHITNPNYKNIPSYCYEALHKGIFCQGCKAFSIYIKGEKCICEQCAYEEMTSSAIMRAVREFQLLFPAKKITAKIIQDWCQVFKTRRTIIKVLTQNFEVVGENRWIHYK
ncbi:nuclease-related domain-containing protein [Virgibacillus oceani]